MADQKKSEDFSEDELDEIIAEMSKEEEQAPPPAPAPVSVAPARAKSGKKAVDQSLTMELTGVVNLKLNFATGDRTIELVCSEDELLCRMADGTEFRIPTASAKKRSAA